jgi:long-chain acyl-CoA synthetase
VGEGEPTMEEAFFLRHYPEGVSRHLVYPERPLTFLLEEAARRHPDRIAMRFLDDAWTYRELDRWVDAFAAWLQSVGVAKGDRVALHLPNCPQMVVAFYGCLRAGAVAVPVNPLYVPREVEAVLADAEPKVVVALDRLPHVGAAARARGAQVLFTHLADLLHTPRRQVTAVVLRRHGLLADVDGPMWREVVRPATPTPVDVTPDDLADLQYTGGTTGVLKAAMLTHRNLLANTLQTAAWSGGQALDGEAVLCALPFFHVYGLTVAMNLAVALVGTMILVPRWDASEVGRLVARFRPALFPATPTMYAGVLRAGPVDLSSVRICISGSAPLPPELQTAFEAATGGRVSEGYGLSEASPVTHCNPLWGERRVGSVGLPFPDTLVRIADPDDPARELDVGEVGELLVSGPQVMQGYWRRPEETAAVFYDDEDGRRWLRTGDLARLDEDGFTYIVDRKKDLIIVSGYNVYPREVEEVLLTHPDVREAAAVGVPDAYRGQVVKAVVVPEAGRSPSAEALIEHCRRSLAPYKVPKAIEFRSELPRNTIGKLLRRELTKAEESGETA